MLGPNPVSNHSASKTSLNGASPKLVSRYITHNDDFLALQKAWQELYSECTYPSVFATWEFVSTWWRHFGTHAPPTKKRLRLFVVTVSEPDGRLVAVAPLYIEPKAGNPLRPRRMRLMGEPNRSNYMAEEPLILFRRGFQSEAFMEIVKFLLATESTPRWDMLYLKAVTERDSPLMTEPLLKNLLKGRVWESAFVSGPQLIHLPGTWQELRSRLSKSMRDNLAYYGRRLTRRGHTWSVRMVRDPDELRGAADHLHRLHALRSASARGVYHYNHMPDVAQLWFLQQILSTLARKEMAMVALLEIEGGVVIGAQAFFEHLGCMTVYYSGYDPEYYDFSPIFILEEAVIKDAIVRGIKSINFLPDEAAWKSRWGTTSEQLVEEMVCSSTTPLGLTRAVGRRFYRKTIYTVDSPRGT